MKTMMLCGCLVVGSALPGIADTWEDLQSQSGTQTDVTDLVQQLVDESRGDIELPAGKFRIETTIEIELAKTGYRSIRGHATHFIMAGPGPAIRFTGTHFRSADPGGFESQVWSRERMPTLTGLAIEGAHELADGVEAVGTMQLTLLGIHLRKLRHGVRLVENNRNVLIANCHIYENSGIGIFYDDVNLHQSNILGCHISYCDGGGIVSRAGNVRNIHITGCDIESNMSADQPPTANVFIDCRGSSYGTAEVAITGCTIQHNDDGPQSANIRMIGQSDATPALGNIREGHVTITGNVLSDVQTNVWLEHCRGVTLTGNTFWMGFEHNLLLDHCAHVVVGPNNFDRNPRYAYGNSQESKNRLLLKDCSDCTLNGLHIAHVAGDVAALTLLDCERMHVSGLTILDCDVGLRLESVANSRFADCFIRGGRGDTPGRRLVLVDAVDNEFDDSLQP